MRLRGYEMLALVAAWWFSPHWFNVCKITCKHSNCSLPPHVTGLTDVLEQCVHLHPPPARHHPHPIAIYKVVVVVPPLKLNTSLSPFLPSGKCLLAVSAGTRARRISKITSQNLVRWRTAPSRWTSRQAGQEASASFSSKMQPAWTRWAGKWLYKNFKKSLFTQTGKLKCFVFLF